MYSTEYNLGKGNRGKERIINQIYQKGGVFYGLQLAVW